MEKKKGNSDQFILLDVKKLKHIEDERKRHSASVMQRSHDMHSMQCPRCSRVLEDQTIMEVTVKKCVQCKGIWFDSVMLTQMLNLSKDMMDTFLKQVTE